MSAIKTYFKEECRLLMLSLEHSKSSDFYISVWQSTQSPLPLLIWRTLLFLVSFGIVIASLTFHIINPMPIGYWFIYLTHWGLILMFFATGSGAAISAHCYFFGPINTSFGLPWYTKVYWVLYSISIPIAFFITIFYWIFLANENAEFAVTAVLNIFIHVINSVLMLLLFLTAKQPTNLLHCYIPLLFGVIYGIFTAVYYVAGGKDPFGNKLIYPVLDWAEPGTAMIMIAISAILILFLHFVIAMLTVCRDAFGRFRRQDNNSFKLTA